MAVRGSPRASSASISRDCWPFVLRFAEQLDQRVEGGRVFLHGQRERGGCHDLGMARLQRLPQQVTGGGSFVVLGGEPIDGLPA